MGLSKELEKLNTPTLSTLPNNADFSLLIGKPCEGLLKRVGKFSLLSPFELKDERLEFFGKYEVGSEEGVLALLLEFCSKKRDDKLEDFLNSLDIGYISAECNIGEEEVQEFALMAKDKALHVVICEDLEFHEKSQNIAKLLSMLAHFCQCKIVYEVLEKDIKGDLVTIADEIDEIESFDGAVVYFTKECDGLVGSSQFALSNRLQDGKMVLVKTKKDEQKVRFTISKELKGTIGLLHINSVRNAYAYEVTKIIRIDDE